MESFTEMVDKVRDIYDLYGRRNALQTAVAPGGHSDTEAIRIPVYSFFLKEFLGAKAPLTEEGPVDEPLPEQLICSGTACRSTSASPGSTKHCSRPARRLQPHHRRVERAPSTS